jgi:integrase/recombinase XerD
VSEVAALDLSDIDWRVGELLVRGKGKLVERLPIATVVAEALAA